MINNISIKKIISALAKDYKKMYKLESNREINQGLCVKFADSLFELLTDKSIGDDESISIISEDYLKFNEGYNFGYEDDDEILKNLPSEGWNLKAIETVFHSKLPNEITVEKMNSFGDIGYHVWIEFNGKFYDAECPNGEGNLFDLPFYKRFFESKEG